MSKILEALDCLKIAGVDFYRSIETYVPEIHSDISETQYFDNTDEFYTIKQGLLEAQDLEKENELLKKFIKKMIKDGYIPQVYQYQKVSQNEVDNKEYEQILNGEFRFYK